MILLALRRLCTRTPFCTETGTAAQKLLRRAGQAGAALACVIVLVGELVFGGDWIAEGKTKSNGLQIGDAITKFSFAFDIKDIEISDASYNVEPISCGSQFTEVASQCRVSMESGPSITGSGGLLALDIKTDSREAQSDGRGSVASTPPNKQISNAMFAASPHSVAVSSDTSAKGHIRFPDWFFIPAIAFVILAGVYTIILQIRDMLRRRKSLNILQSDSLRTDCNEGRQVIVQSRIKL